MAGVSAVKDDLKGNIVRSLASKSYADVGFDYKLDKLWPNVNTMRSNIYKIWCQVKAEPEKFGVSLEALEMVDKAMQERKISTNQDKTIKTKEVLGMIVEDDIKNLAIKGRDKSAVLIHKKMDHLSAHPKLLQQESLVNLAKVFSTFFDKAQIVQGQATENIAVLAKMDDNITPELAMEMLLKVRETNMAEKDRLNVAKT